MNIDENTMKRLIFVRILFENARELSKKHEPYNLASILSLHDAVEFLLKIFADEKKIELNNVSFNTHWSEFKKYNINIPEESGMRRLNETRKSIKHYANLPSTENIDEFIEKTKNVIDYVIKEIGLEYEEVSLVTIIINEYLKEKILEIISLIKSDSYLIAIKNISIYYFHYIYEAIKDLIPPMIRNLPDQFETTLQFERDEVIEFKKCIPRLKRYVFGDINEYDFEWYDNVNVPLGQCKNEDELATKEKAEFGLSYIIKYTIFLEKKYRCVKEFTCGNYNQ